MNETCSEKKDLRWRCRRGMLELDLLLNGFIDNGYATLDQSQLEVFDLLLDYPDQLLLELLLGQTKSADKEINLIVDKIRNAIEH